MNQSVMFQLQLVAQILFALLRETGAWIEDLRDDLPEPEYNQIQQGLMLRCVRKVPYSLVSPYGEWVMVGKSVISQSQREMIWEYLLNLRIVQLERVEDNLFKVVQVEGQSLPEVIPLNRSEYNSPRVCREYWRRHLVVYLEELSDLLIGAHVAVKPRSVSELIQMKGGLKVTIRSILPNGRVEVAHPTKGIQILSLTGDLYLFREGIIK